jgi:hypothetical protein
MRKIYLLTFLSLLATVVTNAQWSDNPAINNAISTVPGEQAIPKIATCPNGDSYIGFFSQELGNYNLRLQRIDSQGNQLWATNGILISNNTSDSWLTDWDMAADKDNHCIMTWQDVRNGNNNAYAYRISPEGTLEWGANGIALSNNSEFNASPKVVTTKAGNSVFAWMSGGVIIMQKISPTGEKLWGANGITLSSANQLMWPQMMPVGNDDIIMKYFDDSGMPNAPTRHVYAQRYDSDGSPVWANPTLVSNAGGISAWTQIFSFINDGSDGFYIAWHDDRDNNTFASVWVQHVNNMGVVQFPANGVAASPVSDMNHFYPYLAKPDGADEVIVFWNEMNGLQNLRGIYGQKFSTTGAVLWETNGKIFIPVSSIDYLPIEARSAGNDVVLLYEQSSNGLNGELKAMRVKSNGNYQWPGNQVTVCSVLSSKVHTVMNHLQNNQWIISWEDDRNGQTDIYAQNLLQDGTLGQWEPQYGTIEGNVTLADGSGLVTDVLIEVGEASTHPNEAGNYSLEMEPGIYTITASLPAYETMTVEGVSVIEGEITSSVDFIMYALRTNLVCKAIDNFGIPVHDVEISVAGPENTYNGIVTGDSLVFENVIYGHYTGISMLPGHIDVLADTTIDENNHHIIFDYIFGGTSNHIADFSAQVLPNPINGQSRIIMNSTKEKNYTFTLLQANGSKISMAKTGIINQGVNEWPINFITNGKQLSPGLYFLTISDGENQSMLKVMAK